MSAPTRIYTRGSLASVPVLLAVALLAATALVGAGAGQAYAQNAPTATAQLQDNEGKPTGTAEFVQTPQGVQSGV